MSSVGRSRKQMKSCDRKHLKTVFFNNLINIVCVVYWHISVKSLIIKAQVFLRWAEITEVFWQQMLLAEQNGLTFSFHLQCYFLQSQKHVQHTWQKPSWVRRSRMHKDHSAVHVDSLSFHHSLLWREKSGLALTSGAFYHYLLCVADSILSSNFSTIRSALMHCSSLLPWVNQWSHVLQAKNSDEFELKCINST